MDDDSTGDRNNFPRLQNDLFLRAAFGKPVARIPVWIMRQAGRYLPEFREIRRKHDFFEICRTPALACEITLQPIRRFNLDAAIIFSDILVVPQALGMTVVMKEGVGPFFPMPLIRPSDIDNLTSPVSIHEQLGYVFEAITLTRFKLNGKVPLLGFCGGPWTLMTYMIEGSGSVTSSKAKKWLYKHREDSHKLLNILTNVIIDYSVGQIEAGAQAIQIFESNCGVLSESSFNEFVLPYVGRISLSVRQKIEDKGLDNVPLIIFAKGAHYAMNKLAKLGYDIIGIDWTMNPRDTKNIVGSNVSLQGNMDPCALYASHEDIKIKVAEMIEAFGVHRYIANLGHGIYQDVDPENVKIFVDSVHDISEKLLRLK